MVYLDSFTTASYPTPPRALLSLVAKQLPSFGASLETAVQDLAHYQNMGFSTLVLVSGEQRALDLQALLREQKVRSAVEFKLRELPQPGKVILTVFLLMVIFGNHGRRRRSCMGCGCAPFSSILAALGLWKLWDKR